MHSLKAQGKELSEAGRAKQRKALAEAAAAARAAAARVTWRRRSRSRSYERSDVDSSAEIVADHRGRVRKWGAAGVSKKKRKPAWKHGTRSFYRGLMRAKRERELLKAEL